MVGQRRHHESSEFDEAVWSKLAKTRARTVSGWCEVVWIGKAEAWDEHLRANETGVRHFRCLSRQPGTTRQRKQKLDVASGAPWDLRLVGSRAASANSFNSGRAQPAILIEQMAPNPL